MLLPPTTLIILDSQNLGASSSLLLRSPPTVFAGELEHVWHKPSLKTMSMYAFVCVRACIFSSIILASQGTGPCNFHMPSNQILHCLLKA
jgi:hypothetical protein